jgi:hypothetical protein
MEKLYAVRIEPGYKSYYVIAKSFNEAGRKALEFVEAERQANMIAGKDGYGSDDDIKVKSIDLLTDEIIK